MWGGEGRGGKGGSSLYGLYSGGKGKLENIEFICLS